MLTTQTNLPIAPPSSICPLYYVLYIYTAGLTMYHEEEEVVSRRPSGAASLPSPRPVQRPHPHPISFDDYHSLWCSLATSHPVSLRPLPGIYIIMYIAREGWLVWCALLYCLLLQCYNTVTACYVLVLTVNTAAAQADIRHRLQL